MSIEAMMQSLEATYRDWGDHLGNPNYCRIRNTISWHNREKIWLENEFDYSSYQEIIKKRQYSLVVAEDGGIIQFHYEFCPNGISLVTASASYYGKSRETIVDDPSLIEQFYEPGLEEMSSITQSSSTENVRVDPEYIEELSRELGSLDDDTSAAALVSFIPSLRIDFTPKATRPFVHEPCHLHIPGFSEARIHVGSFPTPEQFVEMVFAWFYPKIYELRFDCTKEKQEEIRMQRVACHRENWFKWETQPTPHMLPRLQFSFKEI